MRKNKILRCPDCNKPVNMLYVPDEDNYIITCTGHITVTRKKLGEALNIFKKYFCKNTIWIPVENKTDLSIAEEKAVIIMYQDTTTDTAFIDKTLSIRVNDTEITVDKICGFRFI